MLGYEPLRKLRVANQVTVPRGSDLRSGESHGEGVCFFSFPGKSVKEVGVPAFVGL